MTVDFRSVHFLSFVDFARQCFGAVNKASINGCVTIRHTFV